MSDWQGSVTREQPWEQLSLEGKFTVKAVVLLVVIYIPNKAKPQQDFGLCGVFASW